MSAAVLIEVETLLGRLGEPGLVILDCRFDIADGNAGWQAYGRGHVPGAQYAHLDTDLSDLGRSGQGRHPLPQPPLFAAVLGRWGIEPGSTVVCYDDAGGALAAARAWWLLRACGHQQVVVLDGGWSNWLSSGAPVGHDMPAHRIGDYPQQWQAACCIESGDSLASALAKDEILLVDARAAPRFRGEIEPIDPRAGHVPGAVNRPYTNNLQADGRFRPASQLHAEFQSLLAGRDPSSVVHMCGSGVTAAHNLLAMTHAGLPGSRLYAPSWSGWIADPTRPIAIGP